MSKKYKFTDNSKLYFVSFSVVYWIDLFVRNEYRQIVLDSLKYCRAEKGLELYGWCIMTSHVHLIIGSPNNNLSAIMRDMKKFTSAALHRAIAAHPKESRREWMLWMMQRAGKKEDARADFRFWQAENRPIELYSAKVAWQKLDYIHRNPVEAGFVSEPEHWLYSSARDYAGGKGLIEMDFLDPMMM